jgi:CBS domain-containing protein
VSAIRRRADDLMPAAGGAPNEPDRASGSAGMTHAPARAAARTFHRVNSLIPEGQSLTAVSPDTPVAEALQLMLDGNFSQLPVVIRGHVVGAFTLRSFARGVLDFQSERVGPLSLSVDEFVERMSLVDVTAELDSILDPLDADGAVLVGSADRLQGIVTGVDALRYLYELAQLFVQIQEIEQAIREVIGRSVTPEQLAECIATSLRDLYEARPDKLPKAVIDLSFGEYATVITDGRNWELFAPILGGDRARVRARLDTVASLRNDVLHFRRELTVDDRRHLLGAREWLSRRLQIADREPE